MGQNFNTLSTSNKIKEDVARHNENYATLRSQFSGTSFPSSPTTGQVCWRTDRGLDTVAGQTGKKYTFSSDTDIGEAGWLTDEEMSVYILEIINARGSKATLDQRLDIALNEDGTLKAGGDQYSSEWTLPPLAFTYLSTTTFKTDGNTEDIYLATRRLKVNLSASNFKTEVVSAVYSGGGDETTVTIADASLDNTLVSVEHSIISPIDDDGSLTAKMINAYDKTEANALFINNTNEAQAKLGDLDLGQNVAVTSWSFSGTTITINSTTAHNLSVGASFYVSGLVSTTNAPNGGKWTVASVVDADTITFTASSTPTGTPTVSSAILVSGITSISATKWLNDGIDIGGGEILYPDGTIVGTNANGEYTKYPNGDLIASNTMLSSAATDSTTLFPITFIAAPRVLCSATTNSTTDIALFARNTIITTQFDFAGYSNGIRSSITGNYIAKGRWK